jgi:hypothetical protein
MSIIGDIYEESWWKLRTELIEKLDAAIRDKDWGKVQTIRDEIEKTRL